MKKKIQHHDREYSLTCKRGTDSRHTEYSNGWSKGSRHSFVGNSSAVC